MNDDERRFAWTWRGHAAAVAAIFALVAAIGLFLGRDPLRCGPGAAAVQLGGGLACVPVAGAGTGRP